MALSHLHAKVGTPQIIPPHPFSTKEGSPWVKHLLMPPSSPTPTLALFSSGHALFSVPVTPIVTFEFSFLCPMDSDTKGRFQITLGEFHHRKGWWLILTSVTRRGWVKTAPWFSGETNMEAPGFATWEPTKVCACNKFNISLTPSVPVVTVIVPPTPKPISTCLFLEISACHLSALREDGLKKSKQKGNGNCPGSGSFLVWEKKEMCADSGSPPHGTAVWLN